MPTVSMTVNGKAVSADVEPRTLLVHYLRENLGMTGTHVGCDTSQCGACVVHIDGISVKSCTVLATQAEGAKVATIEGLAQGDKLHIKDILIGYNSVTSAITSFIEMTTASANTVMRIDRDGAGSAHGWTQVATLQNITGLTDEQSLLTNGTLIAV